MNFKITFVCICILFWVFLIPKVQSDWVRVSNVAILSGRLLESNKELLQSAPKIYSFVQSIITNGKSFTSNLNLDYAAATVYFTGVIALSYHFCVKAEQQLQKAQLKNDELKSIIDTEILPILRFIEKLHSQNDIRLFCQAKNEIGILFGNVLMSLQTVRKDTEQQMLDSISGVEQNKVLQWLSVGGIGGTAVFFNTMVLTCPQLIAGSAVLLSSFVSFYFGYSNKLTHDETMKHLNVSRLETNEAQRVLRKARADAEIMCFPENPSFPIKELKSLEIYMSKQPTTVLFQAGHEEPKKRWPALT